MDAEIDLRSIPLQMNTPVNIAAQVANVLASLPRREGITHDTISSYYGAHRTAAEYCGLAYNATPPPTGIWQHGWIHRSMSFHPAAVIGGARSYDADKERVSFWVARKDQEEFLRAHGYRHARAIGLPIVYVREVPENRIPGSLLVMPVHSLEETKHGWNFEEYADCIAGIRDRFSAVVVCVHPTCRKKGYWYPSFEKRGLSVIEGVDGGDRNAFLKMQKLFRSFEFVTTNGFGSHIAYSAYFGARTSIFGPFSEYHASDYSDTGLYRESPEILTPTLEATGEKRVREDYPFLFARPDEALENAAWAAGELGANCRVLPAELRTLFGWSAFGLLRHRAKQSLIWRKNAVVAATERAAAALRRS